MTRFVVAVLLSACAPGHAPDLLELGCSWQVTEVRTARPDLCMVARTEGEGESAVRPLESDACDDWADCVVVGPGGSIQVGGAYGVEPGIVRVKGYPCDDPRLQCP